MLQFFGHYISKQQLSTEIRSHKLLALNSQFDFIQTLVVTLHVPHFVVVTTKRNCISIIITDNLLNWKNCKTRVNLYRKQKLF